MRRVAKGKGHVPRRTCIACGRVTVKDDLIRLVLSKEGHLIRDDLGRIEGRGAYACKAPKCLERIIQNRHSRKAFQGRKVVSVSAGLTSGCQWQDREIKCKGDFGGVNG